MNTVLKFMAGVPALGFVVVGLAWWIAPEFAGTLLGSALLSGAGLSTQIADLAAFFLTLGGAILVGLIRAERIWLYPPMMLLGFAIVGRLIAWRVHGAELTLEMIAAEAFVLVVLLANVQVLSKLKP